MTIRSLTAAAAASLLLLLATATACVPQSELPDDCDAGAVQRGATLADDQLDPDAIDVCRGQRVTLEIAVEQDGVLHLHGYDDEAPATEVHAGDSLQLDFTAVRSGQFIIELHGPEGTEAEVGVLTVHEP